MVCYHMIDYIHEGADVLCRTLANGRNPDKPEVMHAMLAVFLPPGRQELELRGKERGR